MLSLRAKIIDGFDRLLLGMDTSRAFGWVVGLSIMGLSLIPKLSHGLPGDSSVYVYLAGRMLDGEQYFTDFFEYNTPFAIGFYALPLAVGRLLGMADVLAAKLGVFLLIIASIALVHGVISRSKEWSVATRYNALIIALFVTLNFRNDFYSNELTTKSVTFLCFILPYIFSLQLRIEKLRLPLAMEIVVGVLQGIAVWFKPQYVLFPLVMELYMVWRMRSFASLFRISNWVAAAVVIAGYGVILPLCFPGYFKVFPYFFIYYSADVRGWISWLDNVTTTLLYCLPFLLWYIAMRKVLSQLLSMEIFLVAVLAGAVVLNAELLLSFDQKSLFAFFVGLVLLYSLLVFARAPHTLKQALGFARKCTAVVAVLIAGIGIFRVTEIVPAFIPHTPSKEKVVQQMVEYAERYAPGEPVATLSDNTEHFVLAMLALDQQPYPVFHSLRMLADLSDHKTVFEMSDTAADWQKGYDYLYGSVLQYFKQTPPRLVFASNKTTSRELTHCMPLPLDILLATSPDFARIWRKHYRKIGAIIAVRDVEWLEESVAQNAHITFGGKPQAVTLPPAEPIGTWLDVYIRRE